MNQDNSNNTNKKRSRILLRILICLLLIALIVLAAVNFDAIKRVLHFSGTESGSRTETFYYNANQKNVYAAVADGLAMASPSGVQYFNCEGEKRVYALAQMQLPSLDTRNGLTAAFDIGGNKLRIFDTEQILFSDDLDEPIIDVSVGAGGYFAVTTQEVGYKGSVTVYDSSFEPAFKWYSGSGYTLCAALSPDNQKLAVASVDADGGRVNLLSLDSETEGPVFSTEGTLVLEICFLSNRALAIIAEDAAYFLSSEGEVLSSYDFDGAYLQSFSTDGEGFLVLTLSEGRSGINSRLVTLDENGTVMAQTALSQTLISLSAQGRYIAVLSADKLTIYDSNLSSYASTGGVSGASQALIRADGTAILISTYSASLYIP